MNTDLHHNYVFSYFQRHADLRCSENYGMRFSRVFISIKLINHPTFYIFLCRCMMAFPDDYKTLIPKLLIETMATLGGSFVSRINLATGDVVPEMKALAKG